MYDSKLLQAVQHVFSDPRVSLKRGESLPKFPSKRIAARLGLSVTQGSLTQDYCNNKSPENPDPRHKHHFNPRSNAKNSSTTFYFTHH
jgi:hypothetical protein